MGRQTAPGSTEPGFNPMKADRRQLLGGALMLGLLVGTPLTIWNRARAGEDGDASPSEMRLLERLSDLVIPATETPGALAAAVPAFMMVALRHGLEDTAAETGRVRMAEGRGGLPLLDQVRRDLSQRAQGDFLDLPPARQFAVLEAYDAEAFAPEQRDHVWRKIKGLILTGYYTSEIGGSRELHYELIPGRFDPDLPLPADNRSWSSDWTAVDFG